MIKSLVKIIVDILVAIEFSDEDLIDEDFTVSIQEQIAYNLQNLSEKDKKILADEIRTYADSYNGEKIIFVKDIPNALGLFE